MMLEHHLSVDAKYISRFLNICDGNWHSCIFVSCENCTYTDKCGLPGFLFLPDELGKPYMFPLEDAAVLFSRTPEPDECLFRITQIQFLNMYKEFFKSYSSAGTLCPCRQFLKQAMDSCYDW